MIVTYEPVSYPSSPGGRKWHRAHPFDHVDEALAITAGGMARVDDVSRRHLDPLPISWTANQAENEALLSLSNSQTYEKRACQVAESPVEALEGSE